MPVLPGKFGLALHTYYNAYKSICRQYRPEEITVVQNTKLRKLVHYCYGNIKYYTELFKEHSITPQDIQSTSDLSVIPVLTKQEIRDRFWDFLPRELPPCRVSRTSGSTGVPVCLLSDIHSRCNNSAAVIRYRKALGIGFFSGPILTPLKTAQDPHKNPHWSFLQGLHKTYYVNPYSENQRDLDYACQVLAKIKKPALIGITPAIRALAYRIKDRVLPPLTPKAVLTFGESLSPKVRDLIESTFKTKVADIYACNEAGDIAWQCRQSLSYHINADNCIVEILKEGRPCKEGEIGEVVITNLNRLAMPILRFKNGDLARASYQECTCGCRLPILSEIMGRTGEDMTLPDGRIIPWNQLKSLMNHPQIHQFQLIQNEDASLSVKLAIPKCHAQSSIIRSLESHLRVHFPPAVPIEYIFLDSIHPSANGKCPLVISNYHRSE